MFPDVRRRLEESGIDVPREGAVKLFHAGPTTRLNEIEQTLTVPSSVDADGRKRAYLASSYAIAEVLPEAEGVVEVEVDVALDLELGMGDPEEWVELTYESEAGIPVLSARRIEP